MTNTKTTHAYFDLKDYVQSMTCIDVAAQMAQSVCFRIDVSIVGAVRQLMKNLRVNHVEHGIDSLSEMTAALSEASFAEEIFKSAGKEELGPVQNIMQLVAIRDHWQELCAELTGMTFDYRGVPRTWNSPQMDEVLTREATLTVKPLTIQRIRMQVERRAGDASAEDIQAVTNKRIALEEERAAEKSRALNAQANTLVTIYQLAVDFGQSVETDGYTDFEFHQLDADTRRMMIDAAMKGASRAEDFATSNNSMTDSEFDAISFAVIKAERELRAVLNGPAYAVQRAMASV